MDAQFEKARRNCGAKNRGSKPKATIETNEERSERLATQIESAWKNTIPGRFQAHLERLTKTFVCVGFNCSRYDKILLVRTMSTWYKARGARVYIQRRGNSLTYLSFDGIQFRDLRHLLPPTSLENFCAMAELEGLSKLAFPFSLLDASQSFLDETELPSDPDLWRSDLTLETPSQSVVDEARQLFKDRGCKNIFEYLAFYLSCDVKMTHLGMLKLKKTFYSIFELDFVCSGRFTISGLSAVASQTALFRSKSVGMFSPNNRRGKT